MTVARTKDLIEIAGGDSTTIGRAVDVLGLDQKPGQGASRVFNFQESLQIVTYLELCRRVNSRVAKKIAAELQHGVDGLPKEPVAVIGEKGLVVWKSANTRDPDTIEQFRAVDPFVIFYTLPVTEIQQIFEPVPA